MSIKNVILNFYKNNKDMFEPVHLGIIMLGTAIGSFGLYNIHQQTGITEGGVLGLILLLNHWLGISSSILSPLLDAACYAVALRFLGKDFIKTSIISTISIAGFFKLWEQFPPMLPDLSAYPLTAALAGGVFVGIGVGMVVRQGGSGSGDDALALTIAKVTGCRISGAYMASDLIVLLMSLSYISINRIAYSLVTVTISSLLIDFVHNFGCKVKTEAKIEVEEEEKSA